MTDREQPFGMLNACIYIHREKINPVNRSKDMLRLVLVRRHSASASRLGEPLPT
ncbi:MAG: hypothetical protein ACI892_000519 [Marinobacter maritimus]|jgi:hypothetical protein